MKISETKISDLMNNKTDKLIDWVTKVPTSHFLKFLCQLTFARFAKSHQLTHNQNFTKEANFDNTQIAFIYCKNKRN